MGINVCQENRLGWSAWEWAEEQRHSHQRFDDYVHKGPRSIYLLGAHRVGEKWPVEGGEEGSCMKKRAKEEV